MTPRRGIHHRLRPGFLLLEVMLGIAVFSLFLTAVGLTLLHGQENTASGGDRIRATQAVERALEASRSIRDANFSSVTAGAHGVALNAAKMWTYSGSKTVFSGGYITTVSGTTLASDWIRLRAKTKWKHGYNRSGTLILATELTDWRSARRVGDWSTPTVQGSYVDSGTPGFNAVAVSGNYAFVASDTTSGGAGLYVFDVSSLSAPSRVSSSFNLGVAGYSVAIRGKTLYVATGDSNQEIRAYDIRNPTSLSSSNLLASFNLSGSSLATSLAVRGTSLVLGATMNASYNEVYSFDISNTGAIVYKGSLSHGAAVNGVALSSSGVYLATADGAAELKQARVSSTGALRYPVATDYNLTCTTARSLAITGTAALLGCQKSASQELLLLDLKNGAGSPPASPGPWYHESSGSVVGLAMDATSCYAFIADDSSAKAFQVVQMRDKSLSELSSYNSTSGPARGVFYDVPRDRVYVLTRKGFLIFQPGAGTPPCS